MWGKKESGGHKREMEELHQPKLTCIESKTAKLKSFEGSTVMPLYISLVTAHFCEYMEIKLRQLSVAKRKLVVTSYLKLFQW